MSKPLWESHMEAAGIEVTDEHRKVVAQMNTAGMINSGYVLTCALTARGLSESKAVAESRKLYASFKRAAKTVRKFSRACRAIQSNHQGKRKRGTRNPYGPQWGGR